MQLFINTRGSFLQKRGERFVVKSDGKTHEFSARKLHSLLIGTSVCLTSDSIQLANENNIDVVFLDRKGHPEARVWQTRLGSTANIRIAQLKVSTDSTGAALAIGWISKKLENQIVFLKELQKRRADRQNNLAKSIEQLTANGKRVSETVEDLDTANCQLDVLIARIRGLEGTSGRIYFGALSELLPETHSFSGRSSRPAHDPFNAMLNYAYGVLYSQVERALILAGLDPFVGFFHANRYGQPSLVFDLIEPFRIIAERSTTLLFTGRRVKQDWFRAVAGGVELSPDGRAAAVEALNTRLEKTIRYPAQKKNGQRSTVKTRNIKMRDTIRHEAHRLANDLLGKHDLPSVVTTESLFENDAP